METVRRRLSQLRNWFVVWFVVESFIGTAVAVGVIDGLRTSAFYGRALQCSPSSLVVVSSVLVEVAVLAAGLWVFHRLLQRRRWARLVLLVVGWLTALGAAASLVGTAGLGPLRALPLGMDFHALALVSAAANSLKLIFWGYVILVLQFDSQVRAAFPEARAGA